MIELRRAEDRGHADHGWLDSRHSFSFADYYDPAQIGWGSLRVINEDRVAPGAGFGEHGHRDMEIISYVISGELAHRDSMGNGTLIRPHEIQRMSAGSGVMHSEFNASRERPVHFLQIWIRPRVRGIGPSYAQQRFDPSDQHNRLRLVASGDGADGSVSLQQDVRLYAANLDAAAGVEHRFAPRRLGYLQIVSGGLLANGVEMRAGDGARLRDEAALDLLAGPEGAQLLLFDLDASD